MNPFNAAKKVLHFFIYSNLLIAFAAMSACCTTYYLVGVGPLIDDLLLLVFSATIMGYILPRLLVLQKMSKATQDKLDIPRQLFYLKLLFLWATMVSVYLFFLQALFIQILLIIMGSLTILYSLPLIWWKQKWWRGREIGVLKIFLIATVWSISTALLPLIHLHLTGAFSISLIDVWSLVTERWLFIFAITLPFDIRDQQYDKAKGLKTIPLLIGQHCTLQVAILILMGLSIWGLVYYNGFIHQLNIGTTLALHYWITSYIVQQTDAKQADEFYTGLLDSTIIMQFIGLYIVS